MKIEDIEFAYLLALLRKDEDYLRRIIADETKATRKRLAKDELRLTVGLIQKFEKARVS